MFYRLRKSLSYGYFRLMTRGVDSSAPVSSFEGSKCELHTMLGRHDLTMYLLAVKSLMSFRPDLAVVVHSDGSLSDVDVRRLSQHIRGARFVDYDEAQRRANTALSGSILHEWRLKDAAYRRLIDIELWRQREKVIILDSDVLTLQEPVELKDWLAAGTKPFLLGQPPAGGNEPPKGEGVHVQGLFLARVPEISAATGLPVRFLQGTTAGFCGYSTEISLERVEASLRASLSLGLPMEQWGGDQCLIIYLLSAAGADRLPEDRYLNFEPNLSSRLEPAAMVHFYGTHRFYRGIYPRLAADAVRRLRLEANQPDSSATR